ncbi:Mov34/MPN/PAD-1 family protein [Acidobacteria bacterium AH-259-O06]|nr:Mov34/MPN/PAD-1 family protein [Acidobacteria bacterium AH-259-O06]
MWTRIFQLLSGKQPYKPGPPAPPRVVLTEACLHALQECLAPETIRGHEGIAYLVGQNNGYTTLAAGAIRPRARTTEASFEVDASAMANVVRTAVTNGLEVVGQVHTHPGHAYHSGGDETGARIAYSGYVSIVLPYYGRQLPSLTGIAAYMYRTGIGFVPVDLECIMVLHATLK